MSQEGLPRGTWLRAWVDFLAPKIIGGALVVVGFLTLFGLTQTYVALGMWPERAIGLILVMIGVVILFWRRLHQRRS